jgi:hypothetical protein
MNAHKEFLYLVEIRFLCDAALRHVETIERTSGEWTEARRTASSQAAASVNPKKRSLERKADLNRFADAMSVLGRTQGEFFVHFEAFLAVLGRLSLILFPQAEKTNETRKARAVQLRSALDIDDSHGIRNRLFRNKWLHHDEVLDDLPDTFQHAQRFTTRDALTETDRQSVIRICLIDEQTVVHALAGEYNIPSVAAALRDLDERVQHAIGTWAQRHAAELKIFDDDV